MPTDPLYLAVDLGAGSGRVFLGGVATHELLLEEARRFHYPPRESEGRLRWDLQHIVREIQAGVREASGRARAMGRPIRSIGVDGWGVDYGLIDTHGTLIEDPVCYRDGRTRRAMAEVFARMPREEIFARTGIQFLDFNTLFQLHAHAASGLPAGADRLLLVPDLIHVLLGGRAVTEYTNATTTQLVNAGSRTWDRDILDRVRLPSHLFTEIVPAGTELGSVAPALAEELGLDERVRIVAPATHDTGSAVAGTPIDDDWAYISSGTWSLVGVERAGTLTSAAVARHNFSNEGGAAGTIDFLRNVMGLWILESCRQEWRRQGHDVSYDTLLREVETGDGCGALIFPDDRRFFNPASMLKAIEAQIAETGQRLPADPPTITKVVLDSIALRYASVLRTIEALTGRKIRGVQIVGGGSRNAYLNQVTATVTGLPVRAGPAEAAATGNVLVQAIAHGRFGSLAEARRHVARNLSRRDFMPQPSPALEDAARRYLALEERFLAEAECSM